jgi:hypothetical protein
MRKIIDYKIAYYISSRSLNDCLINLETIINNYIAADYQPFGGFKHELAHNGAFVVTQAMVKYEEPEKPC